MGEDYHYELDFLYIPTEHRYFQMLFGQFFPSVSSKLCLPP